jgi:hypothetical protein
MNFTLMNYLKYLIYFRKNYFYQSSFILLWIFFRKDPDGKAYKKYR